MPDNCVAVAMSGGVDSSVAAALMQKQGYNIIGITHQTWPSNKQTFGGCCGLEAIDSARAVAAKLGIPYYVLDMREDFQKLVVEPFCEEYSHGRTPNPCILCNRYIRFHVLTEKVLKMGFTHLATGHYARIESTPTGYRLLKGLDAAKDQSYFLYSLGQSELEHVLFPVGDYRKSEVRQIAEAMGLPSAARKDSQDICFIPNGDYRGFICSCTPLAPGEIVDTAYRKIGEHQGLALFTIGQRHGLGVTSNRPLYVIGLDTDSNRVIVGEKKYLYADGLIANKLYWVKDRPSTTITSVTAKIRYQAKEVAARLIMRSDIVKVEFAELQMAVTPGQSVVFYQGNEVLGGGTIEKAMAVHAITS